MVKLCLFLDEVCILLSGEGSQLQITSGFEFFPILKSPSLQTAHYNHSPNVLISVEQIRWVFDDI